MLSPLNLHTFNRAEHPPPSQDIDIHIKDVVENTIVASCDFNNNQPYLKTPSRKK